MIRTMENKSLDTTGSTASAGKRDRILIVDDDVAICRTLQLHLQGQGYQIATAHSIDEGMRAAHTQTPDMIILDIRMPGTSGLEGLPEFKKIFPNTHVIMITAYQEMESTIQAMQRGAEDYIHKPIDIDELDRVMKRILSNNAECQIIDTDISTPVAGSVSMVGRSWAMKEVFKNIGLVAASPVTVLITGDSGTGKELVAQAIHRSGSNPDAPFVAINCAALVETLLESDMFGHEKGAFTGATSQQQGKFALAENGTIFLDEIGELSPTMQAKLLRVLQEKEYTPLGAKQSRHTNARVIAATNVNLSEKVQSGEFRGDLLYRLQVVTLHLPPLRERKEDITALIPTLLARINRDLHKNICQVSQEVLDGLQSYDWPGNVRELENSLAKAVALCSGTILTPDLFGNICGESTAPEKPLEETSLQEIEKIHVLRVLEAQGWHKGKTCVILGISRPRLRRLLNQYGLSSSDGVMPDDDIDSEDT